MLTLDYGVNQINSVGNGYMHHCCTLPMSKHSSFVSKTFTLASLRRNVTYRST